MSIDPVVASREVDLRWALSKETPARSEVVPVQSNAVGPDSGTEPNPKSAAVIKEIKAAEISQDEVQVQRDGQNQIVIKYLDSSGKVIFQVPSSQILALQQSIEQTLDEQVHSRLKETGRSGNLQEKSGHEH